MYTQQSVTKHSRAGGGNIRGGKKHQRKHRFVVITFFKYFSCFPFISPLSHELFITQHYDSSTRHIFPRVFPDGSSVRRRGHFLSLGIGRMWVWVVARIRIEEGVDDTGGGGHLKWELKQDRGRGEVLWKR